MIPTTKTIEIIVSPTGQSTVKTRGFRGASCQEASRLLEQALGSRTAERLTAEFYQSQTSEPLRQEGNQ